MEEKPRLKIAYFLDVFYPAIDGVINVLDNYAKELSKDHDVTVFVPKTKQDYVDDFPYKVVRCKIAPFGVGQYSAALPKLDREFKRYLNKQKFDIVHIHSPFSVGRQGIEYAQKHKIPVVVTCHSQYYRDFKNVTGSKFISDILIRYVAKAYNSCDALWTMNMQMKHLVRKYGYKGKVTIIPNGCDMTADGITEEGIRYFKSHLVESDEKLLLFVGRICTVKNIDFMLNVMRSLKDKNFKFKFILIGGGEELTKFKNHAAKLNLSDQVRFIGLLSDRNILKKYYAAADLFIFPSAYDTDGLVKSEAACFSVPTIFLKGTIAASAVKDGVNGYIGEDDEDLFADKIINIFSDTEKYNLVSKQAHDSLYLTWQDVIKRVEAEYIKLIRLGSTKKCKKHKKSMEKRFKNSKKLEKTNNNT